MAEEVFPYLCAPAPGLVTTRILMFHRADSAAMRKQDSHSHLWEMRALSTCECRRIRPCEHKDCWMLKLAAVCPPPRVGREEESYDLAHYLPCILSTAGLPIAECVLHHFKKCSRSHPGPCSYYVVPGSDTKLLAAT